MTNEELLNMFAGQEMQDLLQKDGLAADKECICKNAWMIARMMLNTKGNDQNQSEKINVSDKRNVVAPDFTISDDNQIKVGGVVRVRAISSCLYGYTGEVVEASGLLACVKIQGCDYWIGKDQLEVAG